MLQQHLYFRSARTRFSRLHIFTSDNVQEPMAFARLVPLTACGLASLCGCWTAKCERADVESGPAELRLVHVIFRHGARTPLTEKYWAGVLWEKDKECRQAYEAVKLSLTAPDGGPAPISKYDQQQMSTVWPGGCMKGELTVGGQKQAAALGQWLRKRYVEELRLLPTAYNYEGTVTGRTTNYARTRATLAGVLTGLYPDARSPIPAITSQDAEEILIGTAHSCSSLSSMLKMQVRRLQDATQQDPEVQQLDEAVKQVMGLDAGHRVAYTDVYDALTTLKYHGKGWPRGMTEELYKRIEEEALRRMAAIVSPDVSDDLGPGIMSLSIGQLIAEVAEAMEGIVSGQSRGASPLQLLSGHDTTIMPILVTLTKAKLERWPGYLSNIVIELWQRQDVGDGEDSFFVRAFYNQEELQLSPGRQGEPLSYTDFKKDLWVPYKLSRKDYLHQCSLDMHHDAPAPQGAGVAGDSVQGL